MLLPLFTAAWPEEQQEEQQEEQLEEQQGEYMQNTDNTTMDDFSQVYSVYYVHHWIKVTESNNSYALL